MMKRLFCAILAVLAVLGFAACAAPATVAETGSGSAETAASASASEAVTFADPTLEAMVRGSMGRLEGDITAAEAEAVTELNLSFELRRYLPEAVQISDIGGLEYFKNLEHLDLSFHAISDVSPLAGLSKLVLLSLNGNPVADVTPLGGLTNLKVLSLSGCAAEDYGALSNLVNLELLALDHSTIADVSPLSTLTGLKYLYLSGSPASDYSPLTAFYPNLEERDFKIITSLQELGFVMDNDKNQAYYGDVQRDGLSVNINHAEWGAPQTEDMTKCVKMDLMLDSGYILTVLYYPEISAYCFQMSINNEQMNYIYSEADGSVMVDSASRERFERMITEALGETGETDALLAPIPVFDKAIKEAFGMTADALYALPME
ncbi:MAG: leucine-rich repeat domain-containing protein [Clostridiaceae bacterium]